MIKRKKLLMLGIPALMTAPLALIACGSPEETKPVEPVIKTPQTQPDPTPVSNKSATTIYTDSNRDFAKNQILDKLSALELNIRSHVEYLQEISTLGEDYATRKATKELVKNYEKLLESFKSGSSLKTKINLLEKMGDNYFEQLTQINTEMATLKTTVLGYAKEYFKTRKETVTADEIKELEKQDKPNTVEKTDETKDTSSKVDSGSSEDSKSESVEDTSKTDTEVSDQPAVESTESEKVVSDSKEPESKDSDAVESKKVENTESGEEVKAPEKTEDKSSDTAPTEAKPVDSGSGDSTTDSTKESKPVASSDSAVEGSSDTGGDAGSDSVVKDSKTASDGTSSSEPKKVETSSDKSASSSETPAKASEDTTKTEATEKSVEGSGSSFGGVDSTEKSSEDSSSPVAAESSDKTSTDDSASDSSDKSVASDSSDTAKPATEDAKSEADSESSEVKHEESSKTVVSGDSSATGSSEKTETTSTKKTSEESGSGEVTDKASASEASADSTDKSSEPTSPKTAVAKTSSYRDLEHSDEKPETSDETKPEVTGEATKSELTDEEILKSLNDFRTLGSILMLVPKSDESDFLPIDYFSLMSNANDAHYKLLQWGAKINIHRLSRIIKREELYKLSDYSVGMIFNTIKSIQQDVAIAKTIEKKIDNEKLITSLTKIKSQYSDRSTKLEFPKKLSDTIYSVGDDISQLVSGIDSIEKLVNDSSLGLEENTKNQFNWIKMKIKDIAKIYEGPSGEYAKLGVKDLLNAIKTDYYKLPKGEITTVEEFNDFYLNIKDLDNDLGYFFRTYYYMFNGFGELSSVLMGFLHSLNSKDDQKYQQIKKETLDWAIKLNTLNLKISVMLGSKKTEEKPDVDDLLKFWKDVVFARSLSKMALIQAGIDNIEEIKKEEVDWT